MGCMQAFKDIEAGAAAAAAETAASELQQRLAATEAALRAKPGDPGAAPLVKLDCVFAWR